MKELDFTITTTSGLHARPATLLVQVAGQFGSEIQLEYKGKKVNLKSIMGVMALGVPTGSKVTVIADGPDEEAAILAIEETMKREGLGE